MLTNLGLVEFVKKALTDKAGYVYGTYGQVLTENLLEYKLSQYPQQITRFYDYIKDNYMGKVTYDCVGLIKGYVWQNDEKAEFYDAKTDVSANGMFDKAKVKGSISTMPDTPGLCVHYDGHIGVYIGNGQVIEARGTMFGVVRTNLKDREWKHWLECPFITYTKPESVDTTWSVKIGDKGSDVELIQRALNTTWNAGLNVDGIFGSLTEAAVKKLQSFMQMKTDGIVDETFYKVLMLMLIEKIDETKLVIDKIIKELGGLVC